MIYTQRKYNDRLHNLGHCSADNALYCTCTRKKSRITYICICIEEITHQSVLVPQAIVLVLAVRRHLDTFARTNSLTQVTLHAPVYTYYIPSRYISISLQSGIYHLSLAALVRRDHLIALSFFSSTRRCPADEQSSQTHIQRCCARGRTTTTTLCAQKSSGGRYT